MIDPTKLLRGAVLALAIVSLRRSRGQACRSSGVAAAQAQSPVVATVLFEGNKRFTDAQLLSMVDTDGPRRLHDRQRRSRRREHPPGL